MLSAEDDRFFGTGVHTESAIYAAHHIDVEPGGIFFHFGVWMFPRFDIDALRRADRRTHVTRDTFQASVVSNGKDMRTTETFRIRAALFGIVDRWGVAFKETGKQPPERDRECAERAPHRCMFLARSFADIDHRNVHRIATFNRSHRSTSWGV